MSGLCRWAAGGRADKRAARPCARTPPHARPRAQPLSYPLEPPRVRFVTPVLHPNVDARGRVCLDVLDLPPKGAWRPALSVGAVLGCVAGLLACPNGDDGVDAGAAHEFRHARAAFDARARALVAAHAMNGEWGGVWKRASDSEGIDGSGGGAASGEGEAGGGHEQSQGN